jgi:CRISPR-associated protein Csb2
MFAIEVEYLAGVSFAARVDDKGVTDWPPQPDRLFSALVASWACGSQDLAERQALEWLEQLPPPLVRAARAAQRQVATVYVPPNDFRVAGKVGAVITGDIVKDQLNVLPEWRRQQLRPRQFPAAIPEDPTVVFAWPDAAPPDSLLAALHRLAARTAYLGHSTSLVRVAARVDGPLDEASAYRPDPNGGHLLRWVYPGRLRELIDGYAAAQERGVAWRPQPGTAHSYAVPGETAGAPPRRSIFGRNWLVLEDDGGTVPLFTAFPIVAKILHRALVEKCAARFGRTAPELLTGVTGEGHPSQSSHLAIAPLADVGWQYSSGRLFGLALILPRSIERHFGEADVQAVAGAVNDFLASGALTLGHLGDWRLHRAQAAERASLQPGRYVRRSCHWGTVTPLVFDRFPKVRAGETEEEIVTRACENIGLPAPSAITFYKYSAVTGAPPAYPPGGNPRWTDWAFPVGSPLATRIRRHVILEFAEAVEGPLLLGAGRYQGLGLCLPLEDAHD